MRRDVVTVTATALVLSLVLGSFFVRAAASGPVTVTVFTTSELRVVRSKTVDAEFVYLDKATGLIDGLGKDLPADAALAEEMVLKRISGARGKALVEEIGTASTGLVKAYSLGISKLPAVLIDDRYVVYGVYSVDDSIEIYRSKRR